MLSWMRRVHDHLRRPAYVGVNRCLQCTIVNVAIAAILALLLGALWAPLGLTVFALSLTGIYFNGYLVPGTPTITRRYFPARVLSWFGKRPAITDGGLDEPRSAIAPAAGDREPDQPAGRLLSAGIIEPCPDEEDLCLAPGFREQWWRRIEQCRDADTAVDWLAAAIDVDPRTLSLDAGADADSGFTVSYGSDTIARWPSRGAFLADLAADPTLEEWVSDWNDLPDRTRTELLVRLRVLLTECPACDRELRQNVDTVSTCCGGELRKVSIECPTCGSVFDGTDT
ncbi:hypothetical protein BRC62_07735 [Halobacteriales archaeon QH_10_67_13]|nr:MAG: hypothetical protein BRC62_07735 [Halobacteriales archaeon QH_10_67_13]